MTSTIFFIGTIITLFLSFILLGKKSKSLSDKILFAWFVTIGIHLFIIYLFQTKKIFDYPHLLGLHIPFPLIHGPFLFIYTTSLTNQFKNWNRSILHFLPSILVFFFFYDFFLLDETSKVLVYQNGGAGFLNKLKWYTVVVKISGLVYILLALKVLHKHKSNIVTQFSNTDKINLSWLKYLISGVGIVWIFVLLDNVQYLYSAVVIFVIFMGYFGINQAGIFNTVTNELNNDENHLKEEDEEDKSFIKIKYQKSGLDYEKAKMIYVLLKDKMEIEQLFLNPDLTLVDLAKALNIHQNYLSQVINTFEEMNFYDYINKQRVNKFISLIENPDNKKYTILSLAFECGFKSKSTFNKQFKKITNKTPSEYLHS